MRALLRALSIWVVAASGIASVGACSPSPKYTKVYQGIPYVHVPPADNQTPYSNLDHPLSAAVRRRLAKVGVEVVGDCPGVLRLTLNILDVNNRPGMVGLIRSARPDMDRILHLKIEAQLQNTNGEVLAGPEVFENQEHLLTGSAIDGDPRMYEQKKREELYEELAEQVAQAFFAEPERE